MGTRPSANSAYVDLILAFWPLSITVRNKFLWSRSHPAYGLNLKICIKLKELSKKYRARAQLSGHDGAFMGCAVQKGSGGIKVPGRKTQPFSKDSRMEGDTGEG